MVQPFTLIRVGDTETSDLDEPSEMVEIGWTDVRYYGTSWQIDSGPHASLVNPHRPISFGAMATHHISQAQAEAGIEPPVARAIMTSGVDYLCFHNAEFDLRHIMPDWRIPVICTEKCARHAWPSLQSYKNGAIRYELELCLDDPRTEPSHRAGPDTWVTAHILLRLLDLLTLDEMVAISKAPRLLLKINFGKHKGVPFTHLPDDYLDFIVNKSDMPNDPTRVDVVHTARQEIQRRAS